MTLASRNAEADHVATARTSTPTRTSPPSPRSHRGSRQAAECSRLEPLGLSASAEYETFADEVLQGLAPESLLEHVLAERVMLAAWRLHLISRTEVRAASRSANTIAKLPPISREVLRAESSLETALTMLEAVRRPRTAAWGHAAAHPSKAGASLEAPDVEEERLDPDDFGQWPDLSNEWPELPRLEVEGPDKNHDAGLDSRWSERLVFDPNVSESSPVVKGTWVTVRQVVSLIVDGWTWSDVLRAHPELTDDDIRACLTYTVEQEEQGTD